MFKKLFQVLGVIPKLGYWNVGYMVWYRLSMKLGIRKMFFQVGEPVEGPFFRSSSTVNDYPQEWEKALNEKADNIIWGRLVWFHDHLFEVGSPPDWFLNPFTGKRLQTVDKHWTELGDFDLNTGDIKIIWEPSRMGWATDLARAYRVFGKDQYLQALNKWLEDWSKHNPKNIGPNWKCGQETSIRLMRLLSVASILDQETNITPSLAKLIYQHLQRISGNIRYAIAQDNNHGTSEAAALYIGSAWLLHQENKSDLSVKKLKKWKQKGRSILEERILTLIGEDGTFSQKSVNYHRVAVDTMSWVLYGMKLFNEPHFSLKIKNRLRKLGEWQYKMTIAENGKVPNIGSNDGAMFGNLHHCDYRDFRPSTQLFFGLLNEKRRYPKGPWDEPLYWRARKVLGKTATVEKEHRFTALLDRQFLIIEKDALKVVLKIPHDRFRPSNDPFHIDVWYEGENILMDTGSFSYNAGEETLWFKSVEAHNAIQFGSHQPMPKISRFLLGEWIKADKVSDISEEEGLVRWTGSYRDYMGNRHSRTIEVEGQKLTITDKVETDEEAVLNLHFPDQIVDSEDSENGEFKLNDIDVTFEGGKDPKMAKAYHSRYYMNKEPHTHLRIPVKQEKLKTVLEFN